MITNIVDAEKWVMATNGNITVEPILLTRNLQFTTSLPNILTDNNLIDLLTKAYINPKPYVAPEVTETDEKEPRLIEGYNLDEFKLKSMDDITPISDDRVILNAKYEDFKSDKGWIT